MLDTLNVDILRKKANCPKSHRLVFVEQMAGFKIEHGEASKKFKDFEGEWITELIAWIRAQHG